MGKVIFDGWFGGKRREKKHDQTILVERADRLQRSCTSEKAFLLIFPCHMPRRQHVLYVCAFSSPGKHCSAHWGASKLGHGVRKKPPFGWPLRWRFPLPYHSPPCHFLLFLPTLVTCIATHKSPTAQAAYRTSTFFPLLYNFH